MTKVTFTFLPWACFICILLIVVDPAELFKSFLGGCLCAPNLGESIFDG